MTADEPQDGALLDDTSATQRRFQAQPTLDSLMDEALTDVVGLGFCGFIYDFTLRHSGPSGEIPAPAVLKVRNVDAEMPGLWYAHDYFRVDPVQRIAVGTSMPFCWSYDESVDTIIRPLLTAEADPVCRYLREHDVYSGVTIPIHLPGGGFATLSGIGSGRSVSWDGGERRAIAELSLLAQLLHHSACGLFDETVHGSPAPRLTPRERECLKLAAEGFSAKQIGHLVERAEPTVIMHINSAMRKLGARNRVHAVTLAIRHRLI